MVKLKITLTRSPIGCQWKQKRTVTALGFKKLNKSIIRPDNPEIRGMIMAIAHLVTVQPEEVSDATT